MLSPRGGQREHRDEDRRHARRYGQGPHGSVERRDALLVGCRGGVLQPGVDVAGFAQLEEPGGMVAAAETVGGRGTDRHAAGSGLPVLGQPGMDLQGLESVIFRFHILCFFGITKKSGFAGKPDSLSHTTKLCPAGAAAHRHHRHHRHRLRELPESVCCASLHHRGNFYDANIEIFYKYTAPEGPFFAAADKKIRSR